jgi:hypothetical protein
MRSALADPIRRTAGRMRQERQRLAPASEAGPNDRSAAADRFCSSTGATDGSLRGPNKRERHAILLVVTAEEGAHVPHCTKLGARQGHRPLHPHPPFIYKIYKAPDRRVSYRGAGLSDFIKARAMQQSQGARPVYRVPRCSLSERRTCSIRRCLRSAEFLSTGLAPPSARVNVL